MKDDLVVTTWSHTSYSDIWEMYYGQFHKHASFLKDKHFMMINEVNEDFPKFCSPLENHENDIFSKRLVTSLEKIQNKNVLFTLEDFVLYADVQEKNIISLNDFLNNSKYSFIRLIKSGISNSNPGHMLDEDLGLYEIPEDCQYLYCLQAAIWKRKDLIKLFDFYKPKNLMESEIYGSHACRILKMQGCYVYKGESKRGNLHWDSSTYPFMSTALHGGSHGRPAKWQTSLYKKELNEMFGIYNIDPSIRGEC